MRKEKLQTITNLFEGKEIRYIWTSKKEEYYFIVLSKCKIVSIANYIVDKRYKIIYN